MLLWLLKPSWSGTYERTHGNENQAFLDVGEGRMMVFLMVGYEQTIEGREQGRRVLSAVQKLRSEGVTWPVVDLVRYCADELDVDPRLPLRLLEAEGLPDEDWAEQSGVYLRTEHGLIPAVL